MADNAQHGEPAALRALLRDPPPDPQAAAQTLAFAIPSGDVEMNGVLYTASGAGPHPTVLLLHGLPGNEQNLDLAQSVRRAGWNVLTLHYRGSWATPGVFSFEHCLEDAAAAIEWLRGDGAKRAPRIDAQSIVVIGHSMGGFVAAHVVASDPRLMGAGLISGVAIGPEFGRPYGRDLAAVIDENVGTSEGLHILSGTSPSRLAEEASHKAEGWSLERFAPELADRPLLLVTSDDGFAAGSAALAAAVRQSSGEKLRLAHFPTDHSYSDHRIALQIEVLNWLEAVAPRT
jgi:pimeloyl-ACP methyl ester carboxylesterase